jgi:hypothetical protein
VVSTLIQRIVLSPNSSDDLYGKVENLCRKCGLNKPIVSSNLRE